MSEWVSCSDSTQLATETVEDFGCCSSSCRESATHSAYLKLTLPQTPESARDSATHSTQILLRLYTDCITQTAQTPHRLYHAETLRQTDSVNFKLHTFHWHSPLSFTTVHSGSRQSHVPAISYRCVHIHVRRFDRQDRWANMVIIAFRWGKAGPLCTQDALKWCRHDMDPDNSTGEDGNPKVKNKAIDARGLSGKPGTVNMIYVCYNS